MDGQNRQKSQLHSIVETAVIAFVLGYGLHYIGYFLRARYFSLLEGLTLDEGITHVLIYFGHVIFLAVLLLYGVAVRKDRKYILSFTRDRLGRSIRYALSGVVTGFALHVVCPQLLLFWNNLVLLHSTHDVEFRSGLCLWTA